MARKTANDFDPKVLKLFDLYVHGDVDRRAFLDRVARLGLGIGGAAAMLKALNPRFAEAEQVKRDDPRIVGTRAEFPSPNGYGTVSGYLVRSANLSGKAPLVLVVHENRGLNPHIEDIARRLALANFIAFAPDALAPLGGYPGDEDKARELFQKLDQTKTRSDFLAAAIALKTVPEGNGKVGVVGFCYGGGIANLLATQLADLGAAVPFYGAQPAVEDVKKIKAPLLIHYADNDDRINAGWPAYEAALKEAKVNYQAFVYPGVQHGFAFPQRAAADKPAAERHWERLNALFRRNLS